MHRNLEEIHHFLHITCIPIFHLYLFNFNYLYYPKSYTFIIKSEFKFNFYINKIYFKLIQEYNLIDLNFGYLIYEFYFQLLIISKVLVSEYLVEKQLTAN